MPTHFVAFQVDDPSVLDSFRLVLDSIKARDPLLGRASVTVEKSHVSLFALDIPKSSERAAVAAFRQISSKHKNDSFKPHPLELHFRGLDRLTIAQGHKLLFANVTPSAGGLPQIKALVDDLKDGLAEAGAEVGRGKSLFLHTSLLNTKIAGGQPPEEIPQHLYEEFKEHEFGVQRVCSVQLLSTKKGADSDGYYFCEAEVMFRN